MPRVFDVPFRRVICVVNNGGEGSWWRVIFRCFRWNLSRCEVICPYFGYINTLQILWPDSSLKKPWDRFLSLNACMIGIAKSSHTVQMPLWSSLVVVLVRTLRRRRNSSLGGPNIATSSRCKTWYAWSGNPATTIPIFFKTCRILY